MQNANVDFFCVRVPEVNKEKEEEHKWLVISPQMWLVYVNYLLFRSNVINMSAACVCVMGFRSTVLQGPQDLRGQLVLQ